MSREWKPGDVAVLDWSLNSDGPLQMVRGNGGRWHFLDDPGYTSKSNFLTDSWLDTLDGLSIRPLVVIDPEDREQVERLLVAYYDHVAGSPQPMADYADLAERLQAALREFADPKPPKPAEPTGLGAVVEASNGVLWVRRQVAPVWVNSGGQTFPLDWHRIDAVRVLSEGIQP